MKRALTFTIALFSKQYKGIGVKMADVSWMFDGKALRDNEKLRLGIIIY